MLFANKRCRPETVFPEHDNEVWKWQACDFILLLNFLISHFPQPQLSILSIEAWEDTIVYV